jgi:hypothetical protein
MKRTWRWFLLALATLAVLAVVYVRVHWRHYRLVFMEAHTHCIKCAGLGLEQYASEHQGRFPFHPKGYGNALLLLNEDYFATLTGPSYEATPFFKAKIEGTDLAEEDCGRVYIQGLTKKSNSEIVLLFDKLPTPGGDHCHFPIRLWAPLGREVWSVGRTHQFIRESEWPEFASTQVDLLVQEGFDRQDAERLFASKPN